MAPTTTTTLPCPTLNDWYVNTTTGLVVKFKIYRDIDGVIDITSNLEPYFDISRIYNPHKSEVTDIRYINGYVDMWKDYKTICQTKSFIDLQHLISSGKKKII